MLGLWLYLMKIDARELISINVVRGKGGQRCRQETGVFGGTPPTQLIGKYINIPYESKWLLKYH